MNFDVDVIRSKFPSLKQPAIFFDNPGGTQIAQQSMDRIFRYLMECNTNQHGAFATSRLSDTMLDETHQALADFLNAARAEEIVFGANMTTITLHISRSISRMWQPGDKIVVTNLDHDANVTPWVLAAKDRDVQVLRVDFNLDDGTLDLASLQQALEARPRLLAVGYASNALGTINPLKKIISMAHDAGAMVYIDAVQYAPHGPIDVQDLDCDFLVCSAYKFFGPHAGILYGKYELLEKLFPYKVRPASGDPPGKFETGTQNHEGIAGVLGALEYLEWVGQTFGEPLPSEFHQHFDGRRLNLKKAMLVIQQYEYNTSRLMLDILEETPGVTLYGLRDPERVNERVPTFSFRFKDMHPRQVAEALDKHNIYVWDGNYYALSVTECLGLEESGGMVRVGPVHYNTLQEVQRFGEALAQIAQAG